MTNTKRTPVPDDLSTAIEHLDLTPEGLADAPALQEDTESLMHTGNS